MEKRKSGAMYYLVSTDKEGGYLSDILFPVKAIRKASTEKPLKNREVHSMLKGDFRWDTALSTFRHFNNLLEDNPEGETWFIIVEEKCDAT